MKNHPLYLLLIASIFAIPACDPSQQVQPSDSTFLNFVERQQNDPAFSAANLAFEGKVKAELDENAALGEAGLPFEIVTIPVVVHVFRTADGQEISTQIIEDQVAALNRDFRRKNTAEIERLPEVFQVLAADTRIQFALATSDPQKHKTNGIVRLDGSKTFGNAPLSAGPQERNPMKFNASGGSDAWDPSHYLNIWVCELDPKLKEGYAALPADLESRPAEDGVVIDIDYFGFSFTGRSKGRTMTNLTAKWLGLKDIWGTGANTGTDEVADTPSQDGPNEGNPSYPHRNDAKSPFGDMFYSFMDATDDESRVMFSAGQADRMYATLRVLRPGMWSTKGIMHDRAADGGPGTNDYFIEDNPGEDGTEPNPYTGAYHMAEGIAVNKNPAPQNMIQSGWDVYSGGGTNYIHVRIRHTGIGTPPAVPRVHVYYADASTALPQWFDATKWTEITPAVYGVSAAGLDGDPDNRYLSPAFVLPATASTHVCLVARMEGESRSCPNLSCSAAFMNLWTYVQDNNNAAWQNLEILAGTPPPVPAPDMAMSPRMPGSEVSFGNFFKDQPVNARLVFNNMPGEVSIFDFGQVAVSGRRLIELWEQGGKQGEGVEQRDSVLVLTKAGAYIGNLNIPPDESAKMQIRFLGGPNTPKWRDIYVLNLEQLNKQDNGEYQYVGGQVYALKAEHGTSSEPVPPVKQDWWKWILGGLILLGLTFFAIGKKRQNLKGIQKTNE